MTNDPPFDDDKRDRAPCEDIAPYMMMAQPHMLPLQHANTIDFPAVFALPRCRGDEKISSKKNRLFSLKFLKKQQKMQEHQFQHVPLERFKTIEPTQSTLDYRLDRIVQRLESVDPHIRDTEEEEQQEEEAKSVNTCPASLAASLQQQLMGMTPTDLLGEYPQMKSHRRSLKERIFGK